METMQIPEVSDGSAVRKFLDQQKRATETKARNEAVVRRFMEEFKNQRKVEVIDELFTPDCVAHLPMKGLPKGREAQKEIGRKIFAALTNLHVTLEDFFAEGDRVCERHLIVATHTGEFLGFPPTGKRVTWTENHIYRVENGQIAELWSEWSHQDLAEQLAAK